MIATASPHNFSYLKVLGADAVFDYRSPTCSADIRAMTKNKLRYAWDCAGGGEVICAEALSSIEPSKYGFILAPADTALLKKTNPLVDPPFYSLTYNVLNEPYELSDRQGVLVYPPEDEMEFAQMFKHATRDLLDEGRLRFIDISLNRGGSGLEGVMKGLDEMRMGRVSGRKLVYIL